MIEYNKKTYKELDLFISKYIGKNRILRLDNMDNENESNLLDILIKNFPDRLDIIGDGSYMIPSSAAKFVSFQELRKKHINIEKSQSSQKTWNYLKILGFIYATLDIICRVVFKKSFIIVFQSVIDYWSQ